jgi:hypothetical protein
MVLFILGIWLTPQDLVQKRYAKLEPRSRLIFYKEGLTATATIFQRPDGARILYLNGIPEVRADLNSVRTFKLMGALPTLLHENPKRALTETFEKCSISISLPETGFSTFSLALCPKTSLHNSGRTRRVIATPDSVGGKQSLLA